MRSYASWVAAALALIVGSVIGYVDSRAAWDDARLTAGALLLSALVLAATRPRHWWIVGLLLGVPVLVFNLVQYGRSDAVLAIVFSLLGSRIGYRAGRAFGWGGDM